MKKRVLAVLAVVCLLFVMAAPVSAAEAYYYTDSAETIPDKAVVDAIFHDLGFSTWGSGYFGVSVTGADNAPDGTIFDYMQFSGELDAYEFEDEVIGLWGYELPYDTYIALVDETFANHGDMKAFLTERGHYNAETGMLRWLTGGFGDAVTWQPLSYTVSGDWYYVIGVFARYDYAPEEFLEEEEGSKWVYAGEYKAMIDHPIIMTLEKTEAGYKIWEYRENFHYAYKDVLYDMNGDTYSRLVINAPHAEVNGNDNSENFYWGFYGIGDRWMQSGAPLTLDITPDEGYEIERVTIANGFYLDEITPNENGCYEVPTDDRCWLTVYTKRVGLTLGDVNGDDKVDSTDARLTLQYFVGSVTEDDLYLDAADVNQNGTVDSTDARLILQKFVGSITEFPEAE